MGARERRLDAGAILEVGPRLANDIVASRMDTMQAALGGVRDIADQMRSTALTSRDAVSRRYLQEAASTALNRINSFLNAEVAGRTAAQLLVLHIRGDNGIPRRNELASELIVRGSTGPAPV